MFKVLKQEHIFVIKRSWLELSSDAMASHNNNFDGQ